MTPGSIAIRLSFIFSALLLLTACNTTDTEPLPAPSAQETLESLDDLPGGIGPSDETPDAPPEEL
jgi:hypothetical protein